jgi:hypothetical protein
MDSQEAAVASAAATSSIAANFMLSGTTYAKGAELGFSGLDFYFAGRGGVLGDVDATVVADALVFFNPENVRAGWESSAGVMSRAEAAQAFADCGHSWGEAKLPDDLDCARLAELAGRVVSGASPDGAPIFAGWRSLPVPDSPKAAALHQCNALRELRMARHGEAILSAGIAPADAVKHRTPQMTAIFGWDGELADPEGVAARWNEAEAATDRAMAAALDVLADDERAELVELLNRANGS